MIRHMNYNTSKQSDAQPVQKNMLNAEKGKCCGNSHKAGQCPMYGRRVPAVESRTISNKCAEWQAKTKGISRLVHEAWKMAKKDEESQMQIQTDKLMQ